MSTTTETTALRAYASMLNTGNLERLAPLLDATFKYESQKVFSSLDRDGYLEYMEGKLEAIRKNGGMVYAEMGRVRAYGGDRPCVIVAQGHPDALVGLVFAMVTDGRLLRLDICIVPPPSAASRSGEYPS